ncbi:MAG: molybdopterin synthase sulfur carrier subunit [Acidiferrobacteraceae bacterium]|jgi:molybdopterin synthase sulfur carrier subunit|nr:molybdopterin synthase sulfur carrier subunit [Acidiferrobacteraceae bacterium]|tara:strand:+ start:2013 stop:2243 length:231 start_codon:yes stop_codon:yes gene_type:complete
MTIHVRFFASLREQTGINSKEVDADGLKNVRDLWALLTNEPLNDTTLIAINKTYSGPESRVKDGDEVAFFPPITGG